jgi:Uma2 family endonuclease
MAQIDLHNLPSTQDLPCSDDTPVDNEDHNLLPNILLFTLRTIWAKRQDWYFGVDMAVYHTTGEDYMVPVVPDAFLSLGVERRKGGKSRLSYATWEENEVVPILVLEMISHIFRSEYQEKMPLYAKLGVLYCVIYNPELWEQRDEKQHQAFEVYKLIDGVYQLQVGDPCWLPEIGLGIGRAQAILDYERQEQLAWFSQQGERYLSGDERVILEQQRARITQTLQQAEQAQQRLEASRAQGFDPDSLPE